MIRNIYQRQDGRYEGRITLAYQNGKRQYKAFFGQSEDEVAVKMADFRALAMPTACVDITFGEAFSEWFQSISIRVKESTLANYLLKADKHILPVYRDCNITEINDNSIYQFIKDKQVSGLSNRYITDILVLMKSVFKYAARTHRIFNPMEGLVMPKKEKTEVLLLTTEQEKKLMRILLANPTLTTCGIILARMTGLRIGELCALQWKDINIEKRTLTVNKTLQRIQVKGGKRKTKLVLTEPKSETSKRTIPIPECIIDLLKRFQGKAEEYVLSGTEKPVEPRTMQYRFATILKNGNLPSVHFHALRHMFATSCVKLGFDIKTLSEILGHSGVEITLNRYVHSSFEQKTEYMDRLKVAI
ncbi:site-specific integrase [uncultured Ruminococcus sp.]|uniref:tyrosine-type recombinase/integrase n=1 Tax=uncultured Ruminococcus sp. TaxID=165186 RepID=UPI0025EF42C1|nr:site-specific integrase [uncultured Ruminococcus sp.]